MRQAFSYFAPISIWTTGSQAVLQFDKYPPQLSLMGFGSLCCGILSAKSVHPELLWKGDITDLG
jgi:hypothetical protein